MIHHNFIVFDLCFVCFLFLSFFFLQAARQSQILQDSYHEKHRDHPDDSK